MTNLMSRIQGSGGLLRWIGGVILAVCVSTPSPCVALELDSAVPMEATQGTPLTIRLTDYSGKRKPAVWLTLADGGVKPKKTKLKVSSVTDAGGGVTSLAAAFKKAKTGPGTYDLHVRPKGKGAVEEVFSEAFTIAAPTLASVSPDTAEAKSEVTLTGTFLGGLGKKPKVRLVPSTVGMAKKPKTKSAKVKGGTGDTGLRIKLPKLVAGVYDVVVENSVGRATLPRALTIAATGGGGSGNGRSFVTARLNSDTQALLTNDFDASDQDPSVVAAFPRTGPDGPITILTAGMNIRGEVISFSMAFLFDPGVTPTPFTIDMTTAEPGFNIAASQSSPGDVSWYADQGVPGTITVTSATTNRVQGTFELTVPPGSVDPASSDLEITNGRFDVELDGR